MTDEMRRKYHEIKPYKNCDKCDYGIILSIDRVCDCSLKTLLELIADIPERYDVEIKLRKSVIKQLENFDKFLIIRGDSRYCKLLAFYLTKKFINDEKIVKYIMSKNINVVNREEMTDDIVSFNKADVIIFEDVFQKASNMEYKYELIKRINSNLITIIVGKTELVEISDDFVEIEIDSSDIEIVK